MVSGSLSTTQQKRPPFYRNTFVIKWAAQLLTLILVLAALLFMVTVARHSLKAKGLPINYDYIEEPVGIQISEGIDKVPSNGGRALWVGMVNTLRISAAGLVAATLLGVTAGIARLSSNWLVSRIASVYVEIVRNIPLLVQIIVIFAITTALAPDVRDYDDPINEIGPLNGWFHVTNKGFGLPQIRIADGFYQWSIWILIGTIVAFGVYRVLLQRRERKGGETYPSLWASIALIAFGTLGWFLHPVFSFLGAGLHKIADLIDGTSPRIVQIAFSLLICAIVGRWTHGFFAARRSPAGSAKLTDNDWFQVALTISAGALATFVVWVGWPGLSSWVVNSSRDLFVVLGDKFNSNRISAPLLLSQPEVIKPGKVANYGPGGLVLTSSLFALFSGVVLYTGGFIAEIVRGGILAVPKGQSEAANAIGLNRMQSLRKVILPQAFRVSLPPLGNQYLNLVKNTSLGIAVLFPELVSVGSTIGNQTGMYLTIFPIFMVFYLTCSLSISAAINLLNNRLAIVER